MTSSASQSACVAIVGGGLAGMAAALRLREAGLEVDLFEARRQLGGRAASFRDPETGELIDFCQHVSLGCCSELADFCRRAGIDGCFRRLRRLHFIGPDGRQYDLAASRWLPAPLHLAPALLRLGYLSLPDRISLARAVLRLRSLQVEDDPRGPTMAEWLRTQGQSPALVSGFWEVVLVSALAESLDRVSLPVARKVLVDGFLADRTAYELLVPEIPLGMLYGRYVGPRLESLGVRLHLGAAVEQVRGDDSSQLWVERAIGDTLAFDYVVLAVPWRQAPGLLSASLRAAAPLAEPVGLESSPITGLHLWFDRPITQLSHAVLVSRVSQWLFNRPGANGLPHQAEPCQAGQVHYYQVVVSASRSLATRSREEVVKLVHSELADVFPAAREAQLLHWQVVTERHAVFSPLPGATQSRPAQATSIPNLFLAGDWTATGWPSTMESAVRSGHQAAAGIIARAQR